MESLICGRGGTWGSQLIRFDKIVAMMLVAFWFTEGRGWASGMVTNCTETALCAAMADGGTVTFGCDGTITLTSTISNLVDTVLDGSGRRIGISGGNKVRVFYVSTNTALTLVNLTISNGHSPDGTNGIWSPTRESVDGGPAEPGGGFYNCGNLTLQDCVVTANTTGTGGDGFPAVTYGDASHGGDGGAGGGIYSVGNLVLSSCSVSGNATGGGGKGQGYTYYLPGGNGGAGGGIYSVGTLRLNNSRVQGNRTANGVNNPLRGTGSNGGSGGGIWLGGTGAVEGCVLSDNITGDGGRGGVSDMVGGSGGAGGAGAAIFNVGILALTNCTLVGNSTGSGGAGGKGGPYGRDGYPGPVGTGAGIYSRSNLDLVNCTVTTNRVGGGLSNSNGTVRLLNSLVALNDGNPADVLGVFQSLGHNLISRTNGGKGFPGPDDLVGSYLAPLDAKLGPLGNNGGPTPTVTLLSGSPAIEAGTAAGAPATDQRGVNRPQGTAVDIGAYEFQFDIPQITGFGSQAISNAWLRACGLPQAAYRLQTSTNLQIWYDLTDGVGDAAGVCEFIDCNGWDYNTRFYRLVLHP